MQRSDAFSGWCTLCRRGAIGVLVAGSLVAAVGPARQPQTPPAVLQLAAAAPQGAGLTSPGYAIPDPAAQRRSLVELQAREKAQARARTQALPPASVGIPPAAGTAVATAPFPAGIPATLGGGAPLAAPQAVSVAITYALAQVGKPYVWGATGPDTYDCSGLVLRSYAMAGVQLPRTSREQARVGTPVALADLLPGDLLFWAYNPADLSTVHHVAMYLGGGKIVQAPQPGEFVEVTQMWLSGYAGAVRVATGPADSPLPPVPAGVPGTGLTPAGDAMPDGSPPPSVPATTAPGTTAPGTTAPGRTVPGTTAPGTTSPRTTAPGTSAPGGTTAPGTTTPGTTASGTTAPGTTAPGSSSSADTTAPHPTSPSSTAPGTTPPGTTAPATTAPETTPPETTPPGTTPPAPSSNAPASSTAAATTSAASSSAAATSAAATSTAAATSAASSSAADVPVSPSATPSHPA